MRAMRISDLSNLNETKLVTQDGMDYTVRSQADFLTDSTGTASCEAGTASADYIRVTSTVTWTSIGTRPPVTAATLVAPPNGSVSANSGALAVAVEDSQNVGIAGVGVSGSGPGSFSGTTGPTGCVIFGNLPAGNYSVTLSGVAAGLVDVDGNDPAPQTTSVVGESTNTIVFQYDQPGEITANFTTKAYGTNAVVPSSADSMIAFNTGMTAAKAFPETPGARFSAITGDSLFPFSSDYAVYAGTCEGDNPNPNGLDPPPAPLAIASVLLPPNGAEAATIQLPALHLRVFRGSSTLSARADGGQIKLTDTLCSNYVRTYTGTSNGIPLDFIGGQLPDPGLPYSDYSVCVDGISSGGTLRRRTTTVSLNDPSDVSSGGPSTTLDMFLTGGSSQSGGCP
jgi:hypothetical protein